MRILTGLALGILLIVQPGISQKRQFRYFGVEQGLCHNFVYSLIEDQKGFLWAGTGNGLCRFDGQEFLQGSLRDSLPSDFVTTSFRDSRGNIWFGHNEGSISLFDGSNFTIFSEASEIRSSITGFSEDENGTIFVSAQRSGIVVISPEGIPEYYRDEFEGFVISSSSYHQKGILLLGTFDGLYQIEYRNGVFLNRSKIEAVPSINIPVIRMDKDNSLIYLGTQDKGLLVLRQTEDELNLVHQFLPKGMSQLNVQDVYLSENQEIWLSTFGEGVFQLKTPSLVEDFVVLNHFRSDNGLPGNFVKQVTRDFEGNIWMATYGSGLVFLADETISFYPSLGERFGRNVLSMAFSEDYAFFGGPNGLAGFPLSDPYAFEYWGPAQGLPEVPVISLAADQKGDLYIGTNSAGIFKLSAATGQVSRFYISVNLLANTVNSLTIEGDELWAGTNAGILLFSLPEREPRLFNTETGLPHNAIRDVSADQHGTIWASTKGSRLFSVKDNRSVSIADAELDFVTIQTDSKGRLWAALFGHGVVMLEGDSLIQFTVDEGLLSNYSYGLTFDPEGNVWVGHRLGISRISAGDFRIRTYGLEAGISGDCNFNALLTSPSGDILFGTTDGLVVYQTERAREMPSPRPAITALYVSDQLWDHTKPVRLPYGAYKLRIEYRGISYSNPEKVKYRSRLEGYDLDWSELTAENVVIYPRIDDGTYEFLLITYNADGIPNETPLQLTISVQKPFWKQPWAIALFILIIILTVILIIKLREREQKRRIEILEREVSLRTAEIAEKNIELERKNNDITDSITYAKRIQGSILPPLHKLELQFPGSFVFYRPRDIVSGDFYWYDKVSDSKFLIVCADSTGHGVPGAFMSMIGTTLIKDICMRPNAQSPADVLQMLDHEVASMLNVADTLDSENATDGMDLTVCEIDLKTNYMRFASAMRPVMLYHNNEMEYLRGSRYAIGGRDMGEKEFENFGYQLKKGDLVYLFTDGYPDQFGGPYGKKYKIVRLKSLVEDICKLPVEKQELVISNEFINWKGDQEQVDDVLFMCIKI
jgi:serine phosphatase RsbU (regulator of sigma subunit)